MNSEHAIWGIALVLFMFIFLACVVGTLYVSGHQTIASIPINGVYVTIILVGLLSLFGLVIYYQYYTTNKLKANITNKVQRKPLIPLNYQYGSDSQEIGMRLRITDNEIIPRNEAKTLQEIWAQLMSRETTEIKVHAILKQILGSDLNDSLDACYNLLWYLCVSESPFRTGLSNREIVYVLGVDLPELHDILGSHYIGAQDRVSMIFAILSGQIIPPVPESSRYEEVKGYPPNIVYNLAFIHNQIIDHNQGTYSPHGPYTYLAMRAASPIENIIASVDMECRSFGENYDALVERLGIGPVNNAEHMTEDEKIQHLQGDLSLYHKVFARSPGTRAPPSLSGLQRHQIMELIAEYTNVELIQAYEPRGVWTSRAQLLDLICTDVLGGARWSIHSVQHCNNDDTMNVQTIESHGDMNKYDREDPTLSYGVQRNYRCYQAGELTDSFREYDGVFLFRVPDWTRNATNPVTNNPLAQEFPLDSIKQLKTLLEHESENYNVAGLLAKIQIGLDFMKSAAMKTRHLKQQLESFTFEQKHIIELYLAWMFTYAMWMRFWKGPGNPWPMVKVDVTRGSERTRGQRTSPQERDEHIFIQNGVHTAIIEMYESDRVLKEWIESLPTIYYDFETCEASCATHTIKSILDQIALGDYCMGFGSDTILKTAYYYITSLLEYPQGGTFDEFIDHMLPQLQDLEYTSVTNQLASVTMAGPRLQMLNNRLHVLHQPIPKQPSFNPSTYQNNVHVE